MTKEDLLASVQAFIQNWGNSPVSLHEGNLIVIKLFKIERDQSVYQGGLRNTIDRVVQRTDFFKFIVLNTNELEELENYISIDNFTIKSDLGKFAELQNIKNENISLIQSLPNGFDVQQTTFIDKRKYQNYLDHLNVVKTIRTKTSKIVSDKFNELNSGEVNTSAIFCNIGYLVKGFEGKYLSLSRGDRTFIKNFIDEQIKEGAYKLTMKETLPLYRESIKEIIDLGKQILELTGNKSKIKYFSKNKLGEERKSLEGIWQLYFDKYLRVMLMSYKEFYSQTVFKKIEGYDKDCRPDFLAVDIYNNVDIIEIKTHRTILFRKELGRDSYYPSHELNKSIFQLNKYLDLKSENIDTTKIENEYTRSLIVNNKIYRPRGILVVSSLNHLSSEQTGEELSARLEKEIKKLKTTYQNIDIVLFDELIKNLENYIQYLDVSLQS